MMLVELIGGPRDGRCLDVENDALGTIRIPAIGPEGTLVYCRDLGSYDGTEGMGDPFVRFIYAGREPAEHEFPGTKHG